MTNLDIVNKSEEMPAFDMGEEHLQNQNLVQNHRVLKTIHYTSACTQIKLHIRKSFSQGGVEGFNCDLERYVSIYFRYMISQWRRSSLPLRGIHTFDGNTRG